VPRLRDPRSPERELTDQFYTVTQLSAELGVTPRAIRFYETKSLLAPRRAGTTRVYTHRDRARLILILRGKRLGFSLREIKEYLDLYDVDHTQREQLRMLLGAVRKRIARLEDQRAALEDTLRELRDVEGQAEAALAVSERERREAAAG
jgi:DNA-binding transcriptional MerR regulator